MSVVGDYWQGVAQRLQAEAAIFNRLIVHRGEVGSQNEASLAEVVRRLLPPTVGVGTGIVIDSHGARSQQTDLIVFDQATQPNVLAQTSQMLFPVETVRLAIEVKTRVTTAEIADAAEKTKSIHALKYRDGTAAAVPVGFFGYECGQSPGTVVREFLALGDDVYPDAMCVMRPGLFGERQPAKRAGLVPLHKTDESGEPVSQQWVTPTVAGTGEVVGSINYPITPVKSGSRVKVLGDPGRALLLFSAELLSLLGSSGNVSASWLDGYLPTLAQELIEPGSEPDS